MTTTNVLITGASTGIGLRITEHLSQNGFYVFAGARKNEDIQRLSTMENVTGIKLDVTELEDIKNSVMLIKEKGGLFALINNAGIGNFGPLLEMGEKELFFQLDVNLVAANRLLQQFFEQLKENKGRIINIASINSFLVSAFGGGYPMSKFGMLAYSEQLRLELDKFEINVSCVEPGFFHSGIFGKGEDQRTEIANSTKHYQEEYARDRDTSLRDENIKDPIQVAKRVHHILIIDKPRIHYTIGNKNEEGWVFQALFSRIIDVNKGLKYPWTVEELNEKFTMVRNDNIVF